jgi:hypothetical protein
MQRVDGCWCRRGLGRGCERGRAWACGCRCGLAVCWSLGGRCALVRTLVRVWVVGGEKGVVRQND